MKNLATVARAWLAGETAQSVAPAALAVLARTLGGVPRNRWLGAYTIFGRDGSPYLTRVFGPRVGGRRVLVHRIWRPDADRDPHNHPWREARFRVVSGGYVEERREVDGTRTMHQRTVGDCNVLGSDVFHRIVWVAPDTWTMGVVCERAQDWGFFVDGEGFVDHEAYFARQGYREGGDRPSGL